MRAVWGLGAAVLLGIAGLTHLTWAAGEGDVYLSIGILEYAEGNYKEAIANFEKARQLDPKDVSAVYYLGLTHNAQGDFATGIRFLEQAKQLDANNLDVRFQLGVAHFSRRNYAGAEPEFRFVNDKNPRYENLGYYLGYVYYERRDFQRALPLFQQNVSTDPQFRQLAEFYSALALQNLGRRDEAVRQLAVSAQTAPTTPLASTAERLARTTEAGAREDRPLRVEIKIAGLFDNNVTVAPNHDILGLRQIPHETLGNLFSLRADYDVYRSERWRATLTYALLQTVYYQNDDFNMREHIGSAQVVYNNIWRDMRYFTGLQYTYEFLTLGDFQFLNRHTVGPFFSLEENPSLEENVGNLTQFRLQLQYKNFQFDPLVTEENRDAFNYLVGVTHFFRFQQDRHYIKVGFEFDKEAAAGFDYSYEGVKALVGFQVTLPALCTTGVVGAPQSCLRARVDGEFHWRSYRGNNFIFSANPGNCSFGPGACVKREDFEKLIQASLAKDFGGSSKVCALPLPWGQAKATPSDCFTVSLEFLSDLNRSRHTPIFQYSRQVVSLGLTWRY